MFVVFSLYSLQPASSSLSLLLLIFLFILAVWTRALAQGEGEGGTCTGGASHMLMCGTLPVTCIVPCGPWELYVARIPLGYPLATRWTSTLWWTSPMMRQSVFWRQHAIVIYGAAGGEERHCSHRSFNQPQWGKNMHGVDLTILSTQNSDIHTHVAILLCIK